MSTPAPAPARFARPLPETMTASRESPFLRAPEEVATVYRVTMAAAMLPLLGGLVLFGWRAAMVTAISVASCAIMERLYYRVTRAPALLGRSHAYLTGVLLAMTLPAHSPWYVPAIAGAFAVLVGKAIFGGVGHFLWQPALVGRLAVGVFFAAALNPPQWPVLGQDKLFWGDVCDARVAPGLRQWRGTPAPAGADAMLLTPPTATLAGLTRSDEVKYGALAYPPESAPTARPLLSDLPTIPDILIGARGGGIGETSIVLLLLGGIYLLYRNYVRWQLPVAMLAAAAAVAIVAPVRFAGAGGAAVQVWWPALSGDGEVGILYVCYQILSGGTVLATFFLAPEMTSRPVTASGQFVFGAGCGALAMYLQLYVDTPIPACIAVLVMNTLTPVIEAVFRPRVLGTSRLPWRRNKPARA